MLIALMSDIHGNREAFEACLADAAGRGIERYVFLGDFVGYGADPGWVIDRTMEFTAKGAVAVLGNHDSAVLRDPRRMNAEAQAAIAWTKTQLDERHKAFLAALPMTVEDEDRLYVHASADAPGDWTYIVGLEEARRSLAATGLAYTFCGHVHVPALFRSTPREGVRGAVPEMNAEIDLPPPARWLAVIGSVGQPRDDNPNACYALFDTLDRALTYVRVPYAVERAAEKIIEAGLPPSLGMRLLVGR